MQKKMFLLFTKVACANCGKFIEIYLMISVEIKFILSKYSRLFDLLVSLMAVVAWGFEAPLAARVDWWPQHTSPPS